MDQTEKTVLIVGGLGIGAVLLFSFFKQQQLNQLAYANQPGLNYQNSQPYPSNIDPSSTLGQVLSGINIGTSAIGSLFSAYGNSGYANDPGLDSGEDDIAYPGNNYTYANSNSYSAGNTSVPSDGYGDLFE